MIPATLMIGIPVVSIFADRYGNKGYYLLLCGFLGIFSMLYNYFAPQGLVSALIGLSSLGIFYSFYGSVYWNAVALVCPSNMVDIGLAIVNTIQNCSTFILPIILVQLGLAGEGLSLIVLLGILVLSVVVSVLVILNKNSSKITVVLSRKVN